MSQDTYRLLLRGYDVLIENAEDQDDAYKITVQEGTGVGWDVILPVVLDDFEGENEELDGSDALMQYLGNAAVDLYEAQQGKLGEGAKLHEEASMKRRSFTSDYDLSFLDADTSRDLYFSADDVVKGLTAYSQKIRGFSEYAEGDLSGLVSEVDADLQQWTNVRNEHRDQSNAGWAQQRSAKEEKPSEEIDEPVVEEDPEDPRNWGMGIVPASPGWRSKGARRRAYYDSMQWEDWFMRLKGTPFEEKAYQMLQEHFQIGTKMRESNDSLAALNIEEAQILHDLNLMNLERMKRAPCSQVIIIQGSKPRKACWGAEEIEGFLARFAGDQEEARVISKVRELLDVRDKIQQAAQCDKMWREQEALEGKMHDLSLQAMQQNVKVPTGMAGAPNMAADLATLMEGVDLNSPLEMSARKKAQVDQIRTIGVTPGWDLQPNIPDDEIKSYLEKKYPGVEASAGGPREQTTRVWVTDEDVGRPDLAEIVRADLLAELGREAGGFGPAPDIKEYGEFAQDRAFGPLPMKSWETRQRDKDAAVINTYFGIFGVPKGGGEWQVIDHDGTDDALQAQYNREDLRDTGEWGLLKYQPLPNGNPETIQAYLDKLNAAGVGRTAAGPQAYTILVDTSGLPSDWKGKEPLKAVLNAMKANWPEARPYIYGYGLDERINYDPKYNNEIASSLGDVLGVPVDFQEDTLVVSLDLPQYERLLSGGEEEEDVARVAKRRRAQETSLPRWDGKQWVLDSMFLEGLETYRGLEYSDITVGGDLGDVEIGSATEEDGGVSLQDLTLLREHFDETDAPEYIYDKMVEIIEFSYASIQGETFMGKSSYGRPKHSRRHAFSEVDDAEVPELGEQREFLDPGCVPEEERLKFVPQDEVKTNKKLSIPGPGWGETTELPKGSKGRIENTYDANGDVYMVRLEDGRLVKISVGDLSK